MFLRLHFARNVRAKRIGSRATHKVFDDRLVIGIEPDGDIVSVSFDERQLNKVFAEDLTPLVD